MTTTNNNGTTLYPPIEIGDSMEEDNNNNMFLSRELKRSFDTVCDIHRAQKCLKMKHEKSLGMSSSTRTSASAHNDNDNEDASRDTICTTIDNRSVLEKNELDARKFEAAVATAIAAESEISTLAKGITELENMLLCKEESSADDVNANADDDTDADTDINPQKFPNLPQKNYVPQDYG